MRRRHLLASLAGLALARPAGAQQVERIRQIGYLTAATGSPDDTFGVEETRALVDGLRRLGWVDGRNIRIEHRFSGAGRERMRSIARELVALGPDVIVSFGAPQLAALLAETRTIPIVFGNVGDPVAGGFVANLAQPGGNATGIGVSEGPLARKWLELLKEIAPEIDRVLIVIEAESGPQQELADAVAMTAPAVGIAPVVAAVRNVVEYEGTVADFGRQPRGGLVALSNQILGVYHQRIHATVAQYRLPAVYTYPISARIGGLLSYGPDPAQSVRELAGYVDMILRGAKPSDLPVHHFARFILAVNLHTARAIGLNMPPSLIARADEVIE